MKLPKLNQDSVAFYAMIGILLLILICAFGTDKCQAQELFQWRWSDQKVMTMPDASGLHLVGSAYLAGTFDNSGKWWKSDLSVLALGTAWEIKDGILPYEKVGVLGGEGFSWGDIQMDITRIITHRIGVLAYNRFKYHVWNLNKISKKVK